MLAQAGNCSASDAFAGNDFHLIFEQKVHGKTVSVVLVVTGVCLLKCACCQCFNVDHQVHGCPAKVLRYDGVETIIFGYWNTDFHKLQVIVNCLPGWEFPVD